MPWFLIGALAFEIALERCEGRADRSGNYLLDEKTVYLELIADIAEGSRQSAGIIPAGSVESIPQYFWAFAVPGEGLQCAEDDPFMPHQGDIIIDFRCNALGAWDTGMHGCGGYRILYSNIRVLSTVADFQQPMVSPGPKPGRLPGKDLCVRIAEEILESPNAPVRGRGFKTKLADAVLERLHAQGIPYLRSSVERYLREFGVG